MDADDEGTSDPIELRFSVDPSDMPILRGADVEQWLQRNPVFMCPGCGAKIMLDPKDVQETIRWGVAAGDVIKEASRKCPSCGVVYFAARTHSAPREPVAESS
jgi:DNA-directed RNA polymerase subunit RPC12/RpoP